MEHHWGEQWKISKKIEEIWSQWCWTSDEDYRVRNNSLCFFSVFSRFDLFSVVWKKNESDMKSLKKKPRMLLKLISFKTIRRKRRGENFDSFRNLLYRSERSKDLVRILGFGNVILACRPVTKQNKKKL